MSEDKVAIINLPDEDEVVNEEVELTGNDATGGVNEESGEADDQGVEAQEDDDGESEDDEGLDFGEWGKQYDLPESIDDEDKLAESYVESLREMKRGQTREDQINQMLKAKGYAGGIDDINLLPNHQQPQQPIAPQMQGQPNVGNLFKENPVMAVVDDMDKAGSFPDEEARKSYRSIAKLTDQAISPQLKAAENVMQNQNQALLQMYGMIQELQWGAVPEKTRSAVDRKAVEALVTSGAAQSLDDAISLMAFRNPKLLQEVSRTAEQVGKEKGRKKLKRQKSLKRSTAPKPQSKVKYDYSKFKSLNGVEWDIEKLQALPDSGLALLAQHKKDFPQ